MSDDRELLELAARAVGLDDANWDSKAGAICTAKLPGLRCFWNPLNDDGDALQLAVRVGIDVHQNESHVAAVSDYFGSIFSEDYGDDPCAATRRAIVRAAADIAQRRG